MTGPSTAGDAPARLQPGADGVRLVGRLLTVGAELEIHVAVSGPAARGEAGVWTRAIVHAIEGEAVLLATSFATFRADASLIARWPAGAAPLTRREVAHTVTTSLTDVAHQLLALSAQFEQDPAMYTDPAAAIARYMTSLVEEAAVLGSVGQLLERVRADLKEKAKRRTVLVPPAAVASAATSRTRWSAMLAKTVSREAAQRPTAHPESSTRPPALMALRARNGGMPTESGADDSQYPRQGHGPRSA